MFKRLIDFHLQKWKVDPYRKPLILRGARQVGKTSSVRALGNTFDNYVEINFELFGEIATSIFEKDLSPERIILSLSLLAKEPIVPGKTLLFLDEIQMAPKAILALRYFYEFMPQLHVIAAGSLLEFAIEKVGLPVGRISILHMYPLSFFEYLIATRDRLIAKELLDHQIGIPIGEPIHSLILDKIGEFLSIGGMPESLKRWVETKSPVESLKVLQQIALAYKQDFEKYARKSQIKYVELLFQQIPHLISKDFSYSQIHGEYRKRELAPALELLEKAGLIHIIRHSSGQGIPIGSEVNFEIFKVIFLDIGLCQAILGSDISIWFLRPLESFENRGEIAEGFIGQELIAYANPHSKADLYFWKRIKRNSAAEIDYLIQQREEIVPIEVKSGHGSTLRSLRLYLETHPTCRQACRFSSLDYSIEGNLDSRPLYSVMTLAHETQREAFYSLLD